MASQAPAPSQQNPGQIVLRFLPLPPELRNHIWRDMALVSVQKEYYLPAILRVVSNKEYDEALPILRYVFQVQKYTVSPAEEAAFLAMPRHEKLLIRHLKLVIPSHGSPRYVYLFPFTLHSCISLLEIGPSSPPEKQIPDFWASNSIS